MILVRGMGLANGFPIGEVTSPVAFNQDIRAIQPPDSVLPRYLQLALRSSLMGNRERFLSSAAHGTLKLDTSTLRRITFPLPPLSEQQRIVDVLDEAFRGIATARAMNDRKLAALDDLKNSLLHQAFTGKL